MSLLLAAALLLQEKTAEETFKKIEDSIYDAKTVSVKFKWEATKKGEEKAGMSAEGTILVEKGNRVFATESFLVEGKKIDKKQISDGSRTAFWLNDKRTDRAVSEYEGAKLLIGLIRVGYVQAQLTKIEIIVVDPKEFDLRDSILPLTEFAFGGRDGEAKTITYRLKDAEGVKGKVWYDPKTLRILKRTIEFTGQDPGTSVETYEEFTLNAEIPDEKFKLPAK